MDGGASNERRKVAEKQQGRREAGDQGSGAKGEEQGIGSGGRGGF
jgi:hypothetical protein